MKKLSILFLSVITLGLSVVSCNDDDDSPSIEGKWEISQIGGGVVGGEEEVFNPNEGSTCAAPTIEFLKDNKLITTSSQSNEGVCESYSQNGSWSKDGNNVILNFTNEDVDSQQKYEIKELTKDKLRLYLSMASEGQTVYQFIDLIRK